MKKNRSGKTNNPSTLKEDNATKVRGEEIAWDSVAVRLREYASNPKNYNIHRFYLSEGYDPKVFYEAVDRNINMKQAHAYAKIMIGCNREDKAISVNATDSHVISRTIYQNLPEYHEDMQERARLKTMIAEAQKPAVINCYSKGFPIDEEGKK